MASYSAHFFAAHLLGLEADEVVRVVSTRLLRDLNLEGLVVPGASTLSELGRDADEVRRAVREELQRSAVCLDRCLERALERDYSMVGLSATFEGQLPAALALARRLRERAPDLPIVLGGAACFERQGIALARSFPTLDAVCHSEGERVIAPLATALSEGAALDDVPGIAWHDRATGSFRHNPSPALVTDLDALPTPDYDDFIEALAASEWRELKPTLFFETARGCWWGEKTLCSFCGLNAEGLPFRAKSPERAVREIEALYTRYPTAPRLHATDNILARPYLESVLPRLAPLASEPRPLRLFWELKPNVSKAQIKTIADAGVDIVQPGIESFSDGVLALMRKGNTALGQLQFIKWATEREIQLVYNILVANPGEEAADYRDMLELIDAIDHLPPPSNITTTWLERFSPYHTHPERYGITDVEARPHYQALYGPNAPLDELAYVFDYEHAMRCDGELLEAQHRFVRRVGRWQYYWRPGRLSYAETAGGVLTVEDSRSAGSGAVALEAPIAAVVRAFDRARPLDAVARECPDLDVPRLFDELVARRWACRDGRGRGVVLVPAQPLGSDP